MTSFIHARGNALSLWKTAVSVVFRNEDLKEMNIRTFYMRLKYLSVPWQQRHFHAAIVNSSKLRMQIRKRLRAFDLFIPALNKSDGFWVFTALHHDWAFTPLAFQCIIEVQLIEVYSRPVTFSLSSDERVLLKNIHTHPFPNWAENVICR